MYTLTVSEFTRLNKEEKIAHRPCYLTHEGEVIGAFVDVGETIILTGLHPRVVRQFKSKEAFVRSAMGENVLAVA